MKSCLTSDFRIHPSPSLAKMVKSDETHRDSWIGRNTINNIPGQTDTLHLLDLITLAERQYPEALKHLSQALSVPSGKPEFHNEIGLAWMACGRYDSALLSFRRALAIAPAMVPALYNEGLVHKKDGNFSDAVRCFKIVLGMNPNHAKAHFSLGDILLSTRDFYRAERHFRDAIKIDPNYVPAFNHLAICLSEMNRTTEARSVLIEAARVAPLCARTQCNLGNLARLSHHFEEAAQHYREAIRLQPEFIEAHFNLSLVLLLLQDFHEGWKEYEWRLRYFGKKIGYPNRYGLPLWEGQSLNGKTILVYDEQGFGDVFMFSRFLLQLKAKGAQIVFETRPALFDLFRSLPYIDEIILRNVATPPSIRCDYCIPLLSLPGKLDIARETIRFDAPYLFPDPKRTAYWSGRLSGAGLKIGLVWQGSVADPSRYCSLDKLRILSDIPGVQWYGLQKDACGGPDSDAAWIIQLGPDLRDFSDTAGAIANLDLIVTIDTAVAHLSGAMGKPVWVLLPFVPDWRWCLHDITTSWYSSMRLYRQTSPGNWDVPLTAIGNELSQWAERRTVHCPQQSHENLFNAAIELHHGKSFAEAENLYLDLLALDPDHRTALATLGLLYLETEKYEDAIKALSLALLQNSFDYSSMNNLGLAYQRLHQPERAITMFFSAIGCKTEYSQAYYNLGNAFMDLEDLEAAITWYRKALRIQPDNAQAHRETGKLYLKKLDLAQARHHFERSLDLVPDDIQSRLSLATTLLMQGDFESGWHHYQWRFEERRIREQTYPLRFNIPRWHGEPFPGKRLIVHCEQGFGDTIQFSRFLPMVKALGGFVTFQVQPQLVPLFQGFPGVDHLEKLCSESMEMAPADLYAPLMDLPGYLNITPSTIPASIPYLAPTPEKIALWRDRINCDKFKMGLVWSGNPNHINDHNRSCDFRDFQEIIQFDGVQCYSLQKELSPGDSDRIGHVEGIIPLGQHFRDFCDTAAAISCLDLVVTVDTAVAHLAGAMGKPTWILLPYLPDWRWMLHRDDSPWYPTVRLFRQPKAGDWQNTIRFVSKAIKKELCRNGK